MVSFTTMIVNHHYLFRLPPDYHPTWTPLLGFDPSVYSRFKYGCPDSMAVYSSPLLRLLNELLNTESSVSITSSAYLNVPTSIALLLDHALSEEDVLQYKRTKLTRSHIIAQDYACLSSDERIDVMGQVCLQFDQKLIEGGCLVVVDDSRVTGCHEQNIIRHLKGVCNKLIFVYLVDMGQCNLVDVEMQMNSYEVQTLEQIAALMMHPRYEISSRVLKRIFRAEFSQFLSFLLEMPGHLQEQLYRLALAEGYEQMGSVFTEKLSYLEEQAELRQQA